VVKFPQKSVDFIVEGSDFIFWPGSVLNFLYLFYDVGCDLLPPFLAFIEIVDLSYMSQPLGPIIVLPVHEGSLHGPPPVQHTLSLFAVSCHL
jgi:hypothetical protein